MPVVAFMSYRSEIPWLARLAPELQRIGITVDVWVTNPLELAAAEETGAFDRVVDLTDGFDRFGADGCAADVLAALGELERSWGTTVLHRDALADRWFTGDLFMGGPPPFVRRRWTYPQIAALALQLVAAVESELETRAPIGIMGDIWDFPSQVVARVAEHHALPMLFVWREQYLADRIRFLPYGSAQWPTMVERFRATAWDDYPAEARASATTTVGTIRNGRTVPLARDGHGDLFASPAARFGPGRVVTVWQQWREAKRAAGDGIAHVPYPELVGLRGQLRRKWRLSTARRIFEQGAARELPPTRFATYFLHIQPEVTVEYQAFPYIDQVATIRNVAAALPAEVCLAVKEHRHHMAQRTPDVYNELLFMPGIIVLHDSLPAFEAVVRSERVLTLTGTVTLEAICMQTPVVLLGDVYYEHLPGVVRPRSDDELREALRGEAVVATEEEILRVFAARWCETVPGTWAGFAIPPTSAVSTVSETELLRVTAESVLQALT